MLFLFVQYFEEGSSLLFETYLSFEFLKVAELHWIDLDVSEMSIVLVFKWTSLKCLPTYQ